MPDREQLDTGEVEERLAADLLQIHRESYGRGAAEARAHLLGDTVLLILDGIELLPNEEFMIGAGEADGVLAIRARYQSAIEATFRAAVERATGRRVVSFASVTKLAPHYSVEIFRLGEPREDLPVEPADRDES